MLVLSRKSGEKLMLGDDIVVQVLQIAGNSVRLGIEAPRSLRVWREEVWVKLNGDGRPVTQ
ncbi:carbon storage regulator, CsrA [Thermomonospora echinospora]|uniref:Translational regulator CsrA n=1 Tax=Thermomonospora echinospora TaxID=1992 RepID=A0A1H6E4Y7_9ACTN|nr:carbon storage regulator CsrA [Thermomonospora echinospora]SEG92056.1 carbon storage regulator, CsrA [Thermomonospora echinospora]